MENEAFINLIKSGKVEEIASILESNPTFADSKTEQGISVLLLAAYYNHFKLVDVLLKYKTTFDIFEAAGAGQLKMVKERVNEGITIDAFAPDGFTALGLACFFEHQAVVEYLLEAKADVNIPSNNDFKVTPLHSAVARKNIEIASMLLKAGADVNAKQMSGVTPLHSAAHNGPLEMVQLLINNGANVEAKMEEGQTPLAMAKEKEILKL